MRAMSATETMHRRGQALLASLLLVWLALVLAPVHGWTAATYPALSGRIVDAANIIPVATRLDIEAKLVGLEDKSGIQLVVATVTSLDGGDIETYANGLFRFWKLGEAKNNNGVLLIVAPKERKVRIEVGYGLEGTLTDALSKVIITNAIAPRFKAGDFGGGVARGVDDIITVLTTDASEWEKRPKVREDEPDLFEQLLPFIIFALFVFVFVSFIMNARNGPGGGLRGGGGRGGRAGPVIFGPSSGGWSGGGSWGGDSGGGFSGGGGSSGGGGASGDW